MYAIETYNLTKTYQGQGGCRDISMAVPLGTIFGLLGPNGAGKSTLVKMLVGLLKPTSGEAKILNRPIRDVNIRKKIGFLPENFRYHDWLTGEDLLRLHGALFGQTAKELALRIPVVLDMVGLTNHRHKLVGSYSKGMQQRIGLGCALLPDPDLLFLDEPTSALDPIGRKMVRDLIVDLRDRGKTIFLNSHLLSELENVCEDIAIIRDGSLIYQGNWKNISSSGCKVKMVIECIDKQDFNNILHDVHQLISSAHLSGTDKKYELVIGCTGEEQIPELISSFIAKGVKVYEVTPVSDSLEKLFLQYVNDNSSSEGR